MGQRSRLVASAGVLLAAAVLAWLTARRGGAQNAADGGQSGELLFGNAAAFPLGNMTCSDMCTRDPAAAAAHVVRNARPNVLSPWMCRFDWVMDFDCTLQKRPSPRTIFVKTDAAHRFIHHWLPLLNESAPPVIYFGNADHSLRVVLGVAVTLKLLEDPRLEAVLTEEKDIDDSRLIAMPIGFPPVPAFLSQPADTLVPTAMGRTRLLLAGCMTMRHTVFSTRTDRHQAKAALHALGLAWETGEHGECEGKGYQQSLSTASFVLAPFGNTYDTYRIWEALWFGAIPIALRAPYAEAYVEAGLPVILVDTFNDTRKVLDTWQDALSTRELGRLNRFMLSDQFWWAHMLRRANSLPPHQRQPTAKKIEKKGGPGRKRLHFPSQRAFALGVRD